MLGIWGEVLIFITSGLFLAHAAVLASRVSGHMDGRFPRHPQVTRRGETQAYHATGQKKRKKRRRLKQKTQASERTPPAGCIIHSRT